MQSLRAYCATLARLVESTSAAIYERQRLLVRAGLIDLEGRGPGGGTKATPDNVALLLVGLLAVDTLADAERTVRAIARAKPMAGPREHILEARTFASGVSMILSDAELAAHTAKISVSRSSHHASIEFFGPVAKVPKGNWTLFYAHTGRPPPHYRIEARVDGVILRVIATHLAAMRAEMRRKEDQQ
jgi:hypothetical protein